MCQEVNRTPSATDSITQAIIIHYYIRDYLFFQLFKKNNHVWDYVGQLLFA